MPITKVESPAMSMVDTWSIWMATLSFMIRPRAMGASVKPAAQFLQQGSGVPAHVGTRRPAALAVVHHQETFESGDCGPALVEPDVDLADLVHQRRLVRVDRQHAVDDLHGAFPVLALDQARADVVLQPQQYLPVGHRIVIGRVWLGIGPQ